MSDTKTDKAPEVDKSKSIKKYVLLAVIVGSLLYVVYDVITKGCTLTEPEMDRSFRIKCGGGDDSVFTCTAPDEDDSEWTLTTVDGVDTCTQDASCVQVGVTNFLQWIQENPALGGVIFTLVYITATVLFIPGSLLTIGAGVAFAAAFNLLVGVIIGTVCVWLGANIGAALAFLLGRFLFREWVEEQVKKFQVLKAIDTAIQTQGLKTVLLLRLSPVIPFNVFNYLMGATAVSFPNYTIGSMVGMLPGTIAYVFIGAALGSATSSSDVTECNPDNTVQTIVLIVGIVATIVAVSMISVYAKKELNSILEKDEGGQKEIEKDSNGTTSETV